MSWEFPRYATPMGAPGLMIQRFCLVPHKWGRGLSASRCPGKGVYKTRVRPMQLMIKFKDNNSVARSQQLSLELAQGDGFEGVEILGDLLLASGVCEPIESLFLDSGVRGLAGMVVRGLAGMVASILFPDGDLHA